MASVQCARREHTLATQPIAVVRCWRTSSTPTPTLAPLPTQVPAHMPRWRPGASAAHHTTCLTRHALGRFNPIEKFNGWLKAAVADDIEFGRSLRSDLCEAVHTAIESRDEGMMERCRGWIDFLFG